MSAARQRIDFDALPEDATARREELERRTNPDPSRPRLPPEVETMLAGVEERTAQCYLQNEELCYRLRRINRKIDEGFVPRFVRPGSESA